jgi:hypothetical protein
MPFGADDALAIGGLLLAFKGALDGYLLIESIFEKDNQSHGLALSYNIQKRLLEKWGEFQNIDAPNPKDCRLSNTSRIDQNITLQVLARIKTLHGVAEGYVKKHADQTLASQSGQSGPIAFNQTAVDELALKQMQFKQRGRFSWSIKNKTKFSEVVQQLREYNRDLKDLFNPRDAQIFDSVLPSQMLAGMSDEQAIRKLQDEEGDRVLMRHAASLKLMQQGLSRVPAAQMIRDTEITPRPRGLSQRRRSLGVLNFRNIWIEWRPIPNEMSDNARQTVRDRQRTLSGILSSITDTSLRVPQHQGFIELDETSENATQTWIGLAYAVPRDCSVKAPVSLDQIISTCAEPPLGEKFKLAAALAQSLSIFHSASWLHKAFRGDNVVFFEGDAVEDTQYPSIANPFITGFDVARPDQDVSVETRPTGRGPFDYYYHPGARKGASKAFDWYSFGVLMLEIAHWKLVPVILEEQNIAVASRQDLEGISKICTESVEFLPPITGDMFSKVVDTCLACNFGTSGDEEMASTVATNIVQVLARLRA